MNGGGRTTPAAAAGDQAKVSVQVAVSPEDAFDVFTHEIDLWWRTGPRYRIGGRLTGKLFLEDGVGGRMFETFETAQTKTSRTIEVGKITVWDPPRRLELEWRGVNFKPHEKTFVEVTFEPMGQRGGTLVTVRHYGWSALPENHPARHGLVAAPFASMIGMWWGGLMTGLREHVATTRPPPTD
jgi:uncharacterized protein YndB with AHSA1/START domain